MIPFDLKIRPSLITPSYQQTIVIGKESSGKSQLIAALTGLAPHSANFRGSTITCEVYSGRGSIFIDTPGILRQSDAVTTRLALTQLQQSSTVLVVVQATHIDDDLADLLPLAVQKNGVVVITFWDKVQVNDRTIRALNALRKETGLAFIPVDARHITETQRNDILDAVARPNLIVHACLQSRVGWRVEPPPTILEHRLFGPLMALALLLLPPVTAVWVANTLAGLIDPLVQAGIASIVALFSGLSAPVSDILIGRYGLVTMGPLLFVWAVPTAALYALILGSYKASGVLDRITVALHPLLRPFGLSGRDLVRIIMGFGCNVPAVINTRACSSCSRGTCISAISFGAACSYQFAATLAVFAATNRPFLVIPYLLYLALTTLIYVRLISPVQARSPLNLLLMEGRAFLEWPRMSNIWRESRTTLQHFFYKAIPIFLLISIIASFLDWLGVITALAGIISPIMVLFKLPPEAALPIILASIRKDGILLFAQQNTLLHLTSGQILTGVYLAGVLFPCLVTALTIIREQSLKFTLRLMSQQMTAAVCFSMILSWISIFLGW